MVDTEAIYKIVDTEQVRLEARLAALERTMGVLVERLAATYEPVE